MCDLLIIGGGAAGLMAADVASQNGAKVLICEGKPSVGRKILMAGKSGLNLSKDEPIDVFLSRYEGLAPALEGAIRRFAPDDVRTWAEGLGQACFIGSSGRLYPEAMKASPLMRAWLGRMRENGVEIHANWRWVEGVGNPVFDTPEGRKEIQAKARVFALGGASWPRLGSDGEWAQKLGLPIAELRPANVGFTCSWSDKMQAHAGGFLKNIKAMSGDQCALGELTITRSGIESGVVYTLGTAIEKHGLKVDLLPKLSAEELQARAMKRGKQSLSNFLRKLGLSDTARALYFECREGENIGEIKHLKLPIAGARPLAEAISAKGGVRFEGLDENFQSRQHKGTYFIGEMLDWSAPTGGYLLTACLAMGAYVGAHVGAQLSLSL